MSKIYLENKLASIEALLDDESLTDTQVLDDIRAVLRLPAPPSSVGPILAKVKVGSEEQFHLLDYSSVTDRYFWHTYDGPTRDIDPDMVVLSWEYAAALL